jgi:hypothetical protein
MSLQALNVQLGVASAIFAFASVAGATPAYASKSMKSERCFFELISPDQGVGCTTLLRDKSVGTNAKITALLIRAGAYGRKGDYARVVRDASEVLKLVPSAEAYYTRALAYHNRGEQKRAISDCDAMAVSPWGGLRLRLSPA